MLTPDEMAKEVTRLNRERGFAREALPPADADGFSPPAKSPEEGPGQPHTGKPTVSSSSAGTGSTPGVTGQGGDSDVGSVSSNADPGPPRFSGVNLDAKLAIVGAASAVLLTDDECQAIVQICLTALNRYFVESMIAVGKHHGIEVKTPSPKPPPEEKKHVRNPK